MQDFMRRYPKAKVRLEYLRPNKVYDAVNNAEVDLGIISYPTASPDIDVIPLRSERMVLVCSPQHRLAKETAVTAEHLQGEDFVAFDRDLSIRKEIDRYLRQRSVNIRIVMEFDNIETIKQAVEIGAGISILPEPPIRDACRNGSLVAVRLIAPELHRPIGIIHRQRKVFTPTAAKFVELLKEVQLQERRRNHESAGGDSGHLPAGRQEGLRAGGHPAARGGHGGRSGARCALRRRGDVRQVPRGRRRRRRAAHGRRTQRARPTRNCTPAAGWPARRPSTGR